MPEKENCCGRFRSCSFAVTELFEKGFYLLGKLIARQPWAVIAVSVALCGLCGIGLLNFFEVSASDPIWVDPEAPVIAHQDWIKKKFPSSNRFASFLVTSDNILAPAALQELLELDTLVKSINGTLDSDDYQWDTVCAQLFDRCWSNSILELWNFSTPIINSLNASQIITDINANDTKSEYFSGLSLDVRTRLGWNGGSAPAYITTAQASTLTYFTKARDPDSDIFVEEDKFTLLSEDWERQFLELRKRSFSHITLYAFATRSFSDEAGGSILGDVTYLSAGYIIIIAFLALILGRFNCREHRIYLAIGGVVGVGLSILVSFGLSSAAGSGYGPVQSILPFLLLGIGVDDVFVIVQSWNIITSDPALIGETLEERAGLALKHAGISITVTSITDFLAFAIGISTRLPALSSFCIYAAFGIIALFLVQATFFSACVVLDVRRREADRNACCCCVRFSPSYEPNECSKKDLQQSFFDNYYGPLLTKIWAKVVILVISAGILGLTIYGTIKLKQEFDPRWFIPSDSYASKYLEENKVYFSTDGLYSGAIYMDDLDLYDVDRANAKAMMAAVNASQWVDSEKFECWYCDFEEFLQTTTCPYFAKFLANDSSGVVWPTNRYSYDLMVMVYLQRSGGAVYNKDTKLSPDYDENSTTPLVGGNGRFTNFSALNETVNDPIIQGNLGNFSVIASRLTFDMTIIEDSKTGVQAMDDLRALTRSFFPDDTPDPEVQAFAYGSQFENWETDKVIQLELYRNIGIAFAAIVAVTLLFLADIRTCLLVSALIIITLVNVGGFMYFWNLTIDTVSSIQLVLAIGLAVDYSAHIGHSFMTVTGTGNERVLLTMSKIGPAVFNGAFSTFLAFALLALSASYVFTVFFKVNLLVVFCGLWNGLVVLPVVLSLVGPPPYPNATGGHLESPDKPISNGKEGGYAEEMGMENGNNNMYLQRVSYPATDQKSAVEPEGGSSGSIKKGGSAGSVKKGGSAGSIKKGGSAGSVKKDGDVGIENVAFDNDHPTKGQENGGSGLSESGMSNGVSDSRDVPTKVAE